MNIRIASAFLLGLATMALAALACSAEAPAPTATPAPQASAQEVVQRSCTAMAKTDQYDFSSQAGGSENGVPYPGIIEAKGSVSGKDYYVTNTDYNDQVLEIRQVGSNVYMRQGTDGVWIQRDVQARVPHDVLGLGDTPICPDLTNVIRKGEETLMASRQSGMSPVMLTAQKRRRWNPIAASRGASTSTSMSIG